MGIVGGLIQTSDDIPTLKVALEVLKKRLTEKAVKTEYLEAFRDEFLHTLPETLGRHFDYDAWRPCLDLLIAGLK